MPDFPFVVERMWFSAFRAGMRLKVVADSFHAKTAAKWVRRFRSEGATGLMDRSSRPWRSPRATSSSLTARVVELRREHRPAYQIAQHRPESGDGEPNPAAGSPESLARRPYELPALKPCMSPSTTTPA